MIKLAFFNDGPLLPIKEGGAEKIVNLLRFENIKNVSEIILFECERPWTNSNLLAKEGFKSVILAKSIFYQNIEKLNSVLKSFDIQGCIFTNPETLLNIGTRLKRLDYKIIYDCHNVFSLYAKRIGQNQELVRLIEFKEYAVGQIADLILPCSIIDLKELIKIGVPRRKIKVIENGVDISKIRFFGPNLKSKNIIFLGNNFYQPNQDAIKLIYKHLYHSDILKDFKFIIAGSTPETFIKKYSSENFIFLGYVDDLNNIFKNATLAIAPLTTGSGTRLKLLNYLSAGIPTLTTTIGAEGLELNSQEIITNDNIDEYPEIIRRIISSKYIYEMALMGRKKVEKKYDWRVISSKAVKYYSKLF